MRIYSSGPILTPQLLIFLFPSRTRLIQSSSVVSGVFVGAEGDKEEKGYFTPPTSWEPRRWVVWVTASEKQDLELRFQLSSTSNRQETFTLTGHLSGGDLTSVATMTQPHTSQRRGVWPTFKAIKQLYFFKAVYMGVAMHSLIWTLQQPTLPHLMLTVFSFSTKGESGIWPCNIRRNWKTTETYRYSVLWSQVLKSF